MKLRFVIGEKRRSALFFLFSTGGEKARRNCHPKVFEQCLFGRLARRRGRSEESEELLGPHPSANWRTIVVESRGSFIPRCDYHGADDKYTVAPAAGFGTEADQIYAPKFCSGSNSGPRRPVGAAAAPASRARKQPEPGVARRSPSSTTTRPRLSTVAGHPVTVRPS